MTPTPRIAIIGAGPVGLTLGSLLTKKLPSVDYTIFDLRADPTVPTDTNSKPNPNHPSQPSGSLDLHEQSGLLALKTCGLFEKFQQRNVDCSEQMIISDRYGNILINDDDDTEHRPEISRNDLTSLLLSSIPPSNIKWEHKLLSTKPSTQYPNSYTLELSHGNQTFKEDFTIVIGADGAWSRVRNLLTPIVPQFSGITNITLTIRDISSKYPKLATLAGKGTNMCGAPGKTVVSQRGSFDSARMYIFIREPTATSWNVDVASSYAQTLKHLSPSELKTKIINEDEFFSSFGPIVKDLIAAGFESTGENINIAPLHHLPADFEWSHSPDGKNANVTLIGDAAHLCLPNGEGVNIGMLDALELSNGLIPVLQEWNENGHEKTAKAILKFEQDMLPRMRETMVQTLSLLDNMYGPEAPESFVNMMKSYGLGEDEAGKKEE